MDKKLYNIIQHYTEQEEAFVRRIWNNVEDVYYNYAIKEIGFCNPNEIKIIQEIVKLFEVTLTINGGYAQAELQNVIVYSPEYEIDNQVCVYELKYNTKFNELEHRHVMGTLYNQGISERLLGDIIISEDKRCQIIVAKELADTLPLLVLKYSNIKVSYEELSQVSIEAKPLSNGIRSARSLRLDAICKSVSQISRNQMVKEIKKGNIAVNHKVIVDLKYQIKENDLLSIKGYGRVTIKKIIPVNGKYNIKYSSTKK